MAKSVLNKEKDVVTGHENLKQRHRDALLDIVLAWGCLDNMFGILYTEAKKMSWEEGAKAVRKLKQWEIFKEIRDTMKNYPNSQEMVIKINEIEKNYNKYSATRNSIVHSQCNGYLKENPEHIVFGHFQLLHDGELKLETIPIELMKNEVVWADKVLKELYEMVEKLTRMNQLPSS